MSLSRASRTTASLLLVAATGAGCRSAAPSGAAPSADEARIQRAVDDRLRALFPEVQGDLTRDSIARALIVGAADDPEVADVPTASIAAIRLGDYPLARGLLGELVARNEVEKAREFLQKGDERSAIAVLDRAVATAPDSAALRVMRGEAALVVATQAHDLDFARSALDDFQEAAKKRGGARALLGASRAARLLGRADDALAFARAGLDALDGADLDLPGAQTPERVWAEATLAARGSGAQGGAGGDLTRESITALHASIARAPEDPWAWRALAQVDLARGDAQSARRTAARGLQLFPEDPELHAALFAALAEIGGNDAVAAEYERLTASHPKSGIARWNLACARFESALDALTAQHTDAAEQFARAEQEFARARTLEGAPAAECAQRIAACRTGTGFARLAAGDLDRARDAFLSIEDASKGALATSVNPRLGSGVEGLAAVGAAYVAATGLPGGATIDALERAARVFDYLREYDRAQATFAIQAASSNRDAAVAIEIDARSLASQKKVDEANRRLAHARELMEKSLAAYTSAIALAPDDALVATDGGYVLTNYLRRDADTAELWLTRAVTLLEARVARLTARHSEPGLDAAEKRARSRELEEAQSSASDAYECLGVLFLTLKGDALRAREWFEKSVASSPEPRESVRGPGGWLDRCRDALAPGNTAAKVHEDKLWGAPVHAPDGDH